MLTILGTLLGGLFRIAPLWLQMKDKQGERDHEARMFDKQLEADKARAAAAKELAQVQGENAATLADIQAMIEATKAQGQKTGIRWVDAINALVRPGLTFWWCIVLETAALTAGFLALKASGMSTIQAINAMWGDPEKAIVASIISFWFVDRAIRKMTGR